MLQQTDQVQTSAEHSNKESEIRRYVESLRLAPAQIQVFALAHRSDASLQWNWRE